MLTPQGHAFILRLLNGDPPAKAYVSAFGLKPGESASDDTVKDRARRLYSDAEVQAEYNRLRAPAVKAAQSKYHFDLDVAMEKSARAHDLAELLADPANMLKAIELQAKLKKLLVSVSEHRGSPLDEAATSDLLLLLEELKARRAVEVIDVSAIQEASVLDVEPVDAKVRGGTGDRDLGSESPPGDQAWKSLI